MKAGWYRWYVLALLTIIYTLNFLDRQILTVLAPYLKADLAITDAQLGLLFGTTFALFYGLFGMPLARLADKWHRVNTLSVGLAVWSAMTMLSGIVRSFPQLGFARMAVGIGEATATPAAFSLLSDYFPKEMRSRVVAAFSSGAYVGTGLALVIGSWILSNWTGAFGLKGWQATFILVGAPGLVLALLLFFTVREPNDALGRVHQPGSDHPLRLAVTEISALFPPWTYLRLRDAGASRSALRVNAVTLGIAAIAACALIVASDALLHNPKPVALIGTFELTTNMVQWGAICFGLYAAISWLQLLHARDPEAFRMVAHSPSFVALGWACAIYGVFTYALSAFVFVYGVRYLGFGPEVGLWLGGVAIAAGVGGISLGGILGDLVKRHHPAGRLYLLMGTTTMFAMATLAQYTTGNALVFTGCYALALACLATWSPLVVSSGLDLIPAGGRATGVAVQTLSTNLLGLGLGPYMVGFLSDVTGDLRFAILSVLLCVPPLLWLLWRAARTIHTDEARIESALPGAAGNS